MYAFFAPSVHNSRLAALPQSVSRTHRGRKLLAHRARYASLFTGTPPAFILLGYRPFSAENCPLDSFPGAANPLAAAGYVPERPAEIRAIHEKCHFDASMRPVVSNFRALWSITPIFLRTCGYVYNSGRRNQKSADNTSALFSRHYFAVSTFSITACN